MLKGLCAYPLTPFAQGRPDEASFGRLVDRLRRARVDSICVLGSTGNFAYMDRQERRRIAQLAVEAADGIPVIVGISALAARQVLALAEDAQQVGAGALMLSPMSYQILRDHEVFELFRAVNDASSLPLVIYDNPSTTHFSCSDDLLGRLAGLSRVGAIKIPAVPLQSQQAQERVGRLRALLPADVSLGVSGDASAVAGLSAGCDAWCSVLGGLFPQDALAICKVAQAGGGQQAQALADRWQGLWDLNARYGSLRVVATAAELIGLAGPSCLPAPLQVLDESGRAELKAVLVRLGLY